MIPQLSNMLYYFATTGDPCVPTGSFLGFPTWYKYLAGIETNSATNGLQSCVVKITAISDLWLIASAILELLLRLGALVAIGFIVYGGVQFVSSEGNPDKAKKALSTVISACVGLVITVASTAVVTFIAGRFN